MTGANRTILGLAAAGVFIAAGPIQAQQQQSLSAEEVKSYLQSAEQELTQAVETGQYQKAIDWSERNIADGASFFVSEEFYVGEVRKSFTVASLNKQDMLQLGRIAVGIMSGMQGQPIENYALNIEVTDVQAIGPDAATVKTRISESGSFAMPGATGTGGQQRDAKKIHVEATADCNHVIARAEQGERLQIGMTNCQARATF